MADEVKSVKDEMNGKSELLPAKWNRFTVADGDWMQSKTLNPLTARDDFLAEQIDKSTTDWQDALSSESATRYSDDQYLSASISSLSGEFYTFSADDYLPTVTTISSDLNAEIGRSKLADEALNERVDGEIETRKTEDEKLQKQIDELQAATDVIAVFGTYDEFVAGSGDLGVTDNDTIKVLRDNNYTPAATDEDYESNDDDGFQVYYEWHDPGAEEPHTDWTGWSAIGSLDPYYSVAEIDEYKDEVASDFASLSATVANNYLSASTDAVKEGHNIKVTKKTGPVIEIATKDNVDFIELSADTAWVDTISADVSAFDFYETTSGKRLSETQQGLLINTTISPFDTTKSAYEGDVFWPANFEQIFSAWYDTDKLINIKYTNNFNDYITRLYTLHNVRQYTENNVTFYDLNFISNDDKVAYTAYAKVKRNGGEGGGAPSAPVLYACDEGPIDVEYTGENGVYVSGDHKVGLSSTYETALKEGSAASAWINDNESKIAYTADFKGTNGVVTGYGTSAFAGGISSISAKTGDSTALFTGYNVNLQAGEGVGFNYGTNLLTISADGKTYAGGNYIKISGNNNSINVTTPLVNSASSGYSAYDWITTKSATLSAGSGINFNSAAQNTLGISVKYTTTNGYVTELDGIPLSAGANYTQGRCITIDDQNKINLSSDINLDTKLVIDHYNSSDRDTYTSATLECFQLKFNGASDNQQDTYNNSSIYDIFGVKLYDSNASKHILMNNEDGLCLSSYKGNVSSYSHIDAEYIELSHRANVYGANPGYIKFDSNYLSAGSNTSNVTAANWASIISAANGRFVSATSQQIVVNAPYQTQFVVTSTIPGSLDANTYYII